jgi:hypothetical protein
VADLTEQTRNRIARSLAASVTLFDFDGDGDLDVLRVSSRGLTLFRNDGGGFTNVTGPAGFTRPTTSALRAVAGDYDNDGRPDIFVLGLGNSALYHNDGEGKFSDVTVSAAIPEQPGSFTFSCSG